MMGVETDAEETVVPVVTGGIRGGRPQGGQKGRWDGRYSSLFSVSPNAELSPPPSDGLGPRRLRLGDVITDGASECAVDAEGCLDDDSLCLDEDDDSECLLLLDLLWSRECEDTEDDDVVVAYLAWANCSAAYRAASYDFSPLTGDRVLR